jgi:DNA mismatch repair protein MutS2
MSNLISISGKIENLIEDLSKKFQNKESFLNSILKLNTLEISETLGLNPSKIIQITEKIMQNYFKISPRVILKTDDIKNIYLKIIKTIESYFQTSFAKNKIKLYYPIPVRFEDSIKERQKYLIAAKDVVSHLSKEDISWFKKSLSNITSLKRPKFLKKTVDRIIITDDKKIIKKLEEREINEFCDIFYINPTEKDRLMEYIKNYESIIFITDSSYYPEALDYSENVEIVSSQIKDSEIIPEKILTLFTSNYKPILASCEIARKWLELKSNFIEDNFCKNITLNEIEDLIKNLQSITEEGEYRTGTDIVLDNYRNAMLNLDDVSIKAETELNEFIKKQVTESAVTIKGEQILNILKSSYDEISGTKMKQYLPSEVIEIFDKALNNAEERVIKDLNLESEEAILVDGLFSKEIRLPIEINRKRLQELENKLRAKYSRRKYQILKELARKLEKYIPFTNTLIWRVQEFDLFLGFGEFSLEYLLYPPIINSNYIGLSFEGGNNLFLMEEQMKGKAKVEPIDYSLGATLNNHINQEKVVILTGANSGGKSRCIELIAQIAILGQMGLPVPAKSSFNGLFDEIHFFAKSRSMVSAGALESSLKKFAKIASSTKSKLALFDEVEAMTESGAAAKILAGFIDILSENTKTCTVMVSHLANDILKLVKNKVRVDGIEAEGLDENLNLIVNRKPRYNYLARSTPELIVERLFKLSKGSEKDFYEKILKEFKEIKDS